MRALVATGPGTLVVQSDVPEPALQSGSVLVRSQVTAVSAGTELRMLHRRPEQMAEHDPGWPAVGAFGYLAAGDVVAVSPDVTGVAVGDRVACGTTWGAHQEVLRADARLVQLLPPSIGYLDGACAYWAVPPLAGILAAQPRYYDDVAVVGLGPLGLAAVQMLSPFCRRVIGVDRVQARCQLAERFGAVVVNSSAADVRTQVSRLSPSAPAAVIQAAGSPSALELALGIVRQQGVVVNVGTLPQLSDFDLFWPMQFSGASVMPISRPDSHGWAGAGLGPSLREAHLADVFDMIGRGRLDMRSLCSWVLPAAEAPLAMAFLRAHPDQAISVAFDWQCGEAGGLQAFERAIANADGPQP